MKTKLFFCTALGFLSIQLSIASDGAPEDGSGAVLRKTHVETKESVEAFGGVPYRRVEYEGRSFYVRMSSRGEALLEVNCDSPRDQGQRLVQVESRLQKRPSLFVDGLREVCERKSDGTPQRSLEPALRFGFTFKEGNKPGVLHNARLGVEAKTTTGPSGLVFSAEF